MNLAVRLDAGASALGLELKGTQRERLLGYVDLLLKWNRTYNLTAVRSAEDVIDLHVLDSLAVLPALRKSALAGRRDSALPALADVGSGAGLPGLVIALLEPGWRITSVEAVAKKAAFQRQACIELGIGNVTVTAARVETLPPGGFDLVVSRAFAELAKFVALAGHLVTAGGRLLAMKGVLPGAELDRLPAGWRASDILPLRVPGLDARRHLIVLEKTETCTSSP